MKVLFPFFFSKHPGKSETTSNRRGAFMFFFFFLIEPFCLLLASTAEREKEATCYYYVSAKKTETPFFLQLHRPAHRHAQLQQFRVAASWPQEAQPHGTPTASHRPRRHNGDREHDLRVAP